MALVHDGRDAAGAPPRPPDLSTAEGVAAAAASPHGHAHASLLQLLSATGAPMPVMSSCDTSVHSSSAGGADLGAGLKCVNTASAAFSGNLSALLLGMRLFSMC